MKTNYSLMKLLGVIKEFQQMSKKQTLLEFIKFHMEFILMIYCPLFVKYLGIEIMILLLPDNLQ